MKSKKNILVIPVPLYRVTVLVAWDVPIESVGRHCRKHGCNITKEWIKDRVSFAEGANGICTNLGEGNTDVLVWLKNNLHRRSKASEFGILYHELYHAVDRIGKSHNLMEEEEARAYIFEYLVFRCNQFFWKKKK